MTTSEQAASIDRRLNHALKYNEKRFQVTKLMTEERGFGPLHPVVVDFVLKLSEQEIDAYLEVRNV